MRWKEACYGGTDVMERPCAVARGKDINIKDKELLEARGVGRTGNIILIPTRFVRVPHDWALHY
jgi:hypothetical protein